MGLIKPGGEQPQVQVGHEGAQQEQTVTGFHIAADILEPRGPLIDSHIEIPGVGNHRFGQDGCGHRDALVPGQGREFLLQSKPVDLDTGQDDGTRRLVNQGYRFRQGLGQGLWIAGLLFSLFLMPGRTEGGNHITREFDIDGTLIFQGGMNDPVDFNLSGCGGIKDG